MQGRRCGQLACAVVQAGTVLRCFDDVMACDADLDRVLEVDVASEARRASLAALWRQLEGIDGAAEQQALRMLLLRAARIAESRSNSAVADDLVQLAMKDARWLVTRGALEACGPLDVPIRVIVRDGPPVDAFIENQLRLTCIGPTPQAARVELLRC